MPRRDDNRVLLELLGAAHGALPRFLVLRQRVEAKRRERGRVKLNAAGRRVEPWLAIGSQQALLVAIVFNLWPRRDLLHLVSKGLPLWRVVRVVGDLPLAKLSFGSDVVEDLVRELGVQAVDQVDGNLVVRARLTLRSNDGHARARRSPPFADRRSLGGHRDGKEQVANRACRRRHDIVEHHVKVHLHHGLVHTRCLGTHVRDGVGTLEIEHLDGVRVSRFDGIEHAVCLGARRNAELVHGGHGVAETLRLKLRIEPFPPARVGQLHIPRKARHAHPTGRLEVSRQRRKRHNRVHFVNAVCMGVGREAPLQRRGPRRAEQTRGASDVLRVDSAHFRCPLGRPILHTLGKLSEPVGPLLDKIMVVEVFADDHVDHRHSERRIGRGMNLQKHLGVRRQPGDLGIDDHEIRAATAHRIDDPMPEKAIAVGNDRVVAPDQAHFWPFVTRVVVAQLGELRHVGDRAIAVRDHRARHAREHARVARQKAARQIRRLERDIARERQLAVHVAPRTDEPDNGLRAVVLLDAAHVLLDKVIRLIPTALLPRIIVAALGGVASHGVDDSVLPVNRLELIQTADAQAPLVEGSARVALDMIEYAVLHVIHQPAPVMATGRRPMGRTVHIEVSLFPMPLASVELFVVLRHLLSPLDFSHFTLSFSACFATGVLYGQSAKPESAGLSPCPQGHAHHFPLRWHKMGAGATISNSSSPHLGQGRLSVDRTSPLEKNMTAPHEGHVATFCFGGLHLPQTGLHAQHISSPI